MLKLISATPSPFARKVRIALSEKGLSFELITEVPWDKTTQTPKHNPLEKLPVLLLEDGTALYESSYILDYLDVKHPTPRLLPEDEDEMLAARKLEVLCDGICDAVVLSLFERMRGDKMSPPWLARQARKIEGGFAEMARLRGDGVWAVGNRFSRGDIAVGVAVGYADVRYPDHDWRGLYPNLLAAFDQLEERPSFADTRPRPQAMTDQVV